MAFTEPTDTEVLLDKLKQSFPNLKYDKFKHIKTGYDHDILIIGEYVYRFPKTAYYVQQLKLEPNLMQYLSEKSNLIFPKYDYIAADFSFGRHRFIKGAEVTKQTFKNLSNYRFDLITTNIACFLSTLHTIPSFKYTAFGFVRNQYDTALGKVPHYVPTHSDLDLNNMIWDNEYGLGIIDFGDRSLFDPAYDFCVFNIFGKKFMNQIYEKYEGVKDANFLKRANLYYQRYISSK